MTQKVDLAFYLKALPLYARNLGVLLPPLVAGLIAIGVERFGEWLTQAEPGALGSIIGLITWIIFGFAFGVSIIFADDAWRHGRASLSSAWNQSRLKAGDILLAALGFFFLIYIALLIGGFLGSPILALALGALALWAFIYSIAAASIGGIPGGASLSVSLNAARRHPLGTAILAFVSIVVWYGLTEYALTAISAYVGVGYYAADVLLKAIAIGYIALIISHEYTDLAFHRRW